MNYKDAKAVLEVCEKIGFEDWKVRYGSSDCDWECGKKHSEPACYKKASECEHIKQSEPADIAGLFTIDCDEFMGLSNEVADYLAFAHKALPYWLAEAERLRAENEKLKTLGVYQALRHAYKCPSCVGYDTPSKEWSELLEAYQVLAGLEG